MVLAIHGGELPSLDDYPELMSKRSTWDLLERLWERDLSQRLSVAQTLLQFKRLAQDPLLEEASNHTSSVPNPREDGNVVNMTTTSMAELGPKTQWTV